MTVSLTPALSPGGEGDLERALRDFHGKQVHHRGFQASAFVRQHFCLAAEPMSISLASLNGILSVPTL